MAIFKSQFTNFWASQVALVVKKTSLPMQEKWEPRVRSLGQEDPKKGMTTLFSVNCLTWAGLSSFNTCLGNPDLHLKESEPNFVAKNYHLWLSADRKHQPLSPVNLFPCSYHVISTYVLMITHINYLSSRVTPSFPYCFFFIYLY